MKSAEKRGELFFRLGKFGGGNSANSTPSPLDQVKQLKIDTRAKNMIVGEYWLKSARESVLKGEFGANPPGSDSKAIPVPTLLRDCGILKGSKPKKEIPKERKL